MTRCFLLRVDFRARFAQGFVIILEILTRSFFDGRRLVPSPFYLRVALRHRLLDRREKRPAHKKIKQENDNDGRHSLKKQVAELVEDIHRQESVVMRLPRLFSLT